jgi:uncharacterized protein YndB with AHSA1/START domain
MREPRLIALVLLAAAMSCAASARAEVISASDGHFVVKNQLAVAATPPAVWHALTAEIGKWWSPDHTWSGKAANLSLDPRPGGCFCEKLPDGGVRHMQVVYAQPPGLLRLEGGLGPLQEQALFGAMSWRIAPAADGCTLEVVYRVAGAAERGLTALAPLVDSVMGLQVERLKRFLETGSPEGGAAVK